MSENIKLQKQVYNKGDYSKVIDTSFTQLGVSTIEQQIDSQPTVSDFFNLYNDLFYDISELGSTNSHEYLIKKSSEYINFEANQDLLLSLQNEIAQLRIELLETQQQLYSFQSVNNIPT